MHPVICILPDEPITPVEPRTEASAAVALCWCRKRRKASCEDRGPNRLLCHCGHTCKAEMIRYQGVFATVDWLTLPTSLICSRAPPVAELQNDMDDYVQVSLPGS